MTLHAFPCRWWIEHSGDRVVLSGRLKVDSFGKLILRECDIRCTHARTECEIKLLLEHARVNFGWFEGKRLAEGQLGVAFLKIAIRNTRRAACALQALRPSF